MNSIVGQRLKKAMGFAFCFMGGFFLLIGFLFGALFEEPVLYSLAIFGAVIVLIGILMFRSVKNVSFFDTILITGKKDRRCIKCGRIVPWDAKLCPYCGENFEPLETSKSNGNAINKSIDRNKQDQLCKICGSAIKPGVIFCQYCGSEQ